MRLTWAVLSTGLLGCSGSTGSGNAEGSFGQQFARAICARIFSCCNAAESTRLGYTSEAQCAATVGSQQQRSFDQALSTGMVRFDAPAALTCVDDIAASSCSALFWDLGRLTTPPSCSAVIPGSGQTGAPCGDLDFVCASHDCESDYCAAPSCRTVTCPAGQYCEPASLACVPGQPLGATCTYNAECDPSIVCRAGTCGLRCQTDRSAPRTQIVRAVPACRSRARPADRRAGRPNPTARPARAPANARAAGALRQFRVDPPRADVHQVGLTCVLLLGAPGR